MRALAAAALLLALAGCSTGGAVKPAPARPLPFAPPPPPMASEGLACTQEAKQCPDGSYVGRNPAKGCAFNPCPGETNK